MTALWLMSESTAEKWDPIIMNDFHYKAISSKMNLPDWPLR